MLPSGRPILVAATSGLLIIVGCASVVVGCAGARSVGTMGTGGGGGAGRDAGHEARPRPDAHEAPDPHLCGNGQADPGEDCDDGNVKGDDGCSLLCQVEPGWTCDVFGQPCKPPVCGDGKLATSESCDDGNTHDGDGCSADCQTVEDGWRCRAAGKPCVPLCGDGKVLGGETCDDNNSDNGDGCSSNCLLEPGWDCSHLPCVKSVCGNKKVETGESCDEGDASIPGGKNGLFYGDGTGCSKTCTKEPKCRDDSPQHRNRACDAVCGNGNIDVGEECDDGDLENGDGCSDHCTLEAGFGCTEQPGTDSEACSSGAGRCLKLPIIYRDFKNESLVGGHPDFFFLGGRSAVAPTTGQLRSCVPNSGGLHRKVTSGDSTARCWGIAADDLNNGKPEYRSGPTSTTTYQCPCQFSDWSLNNSGAHLGGLYNDAMSPITGLPNNGGVSGVNKSWSSVAAGLPGVPLVINGTTFGQWYKDDSGFSTRTQGILELSDIGGNQFRFSSADDVITGGFFPLDASVAANSETALCNLWPYWFNFAGCVGDQYLFPPSQGVTAAQGAWITPVTGHKHDFYFTTEVHYLFVFTPPLQLKFYGDDDLFIYINGKLVLDLGGIHQRLPGQVDVGTDGNADVIEGGILNPTTGNIEFTYADPNNPTTTVTLTQPDDYRKRRVLLGLEPNRIYEIAVFHADRAPTESNYQLTLSGFATTRSVCEAHCGDGIRSGAEECDCGDGPDHPGQDPACDGPNDSSRYNGCTTDCKLGPFCGDEITNGAEECDIGRQNGVNLDRDTGCTVKCTFPGYCGDGKVNGDEKCDYGENNGVIYEDKPSCSDKCVIIIP